MSRLGRIPLAGAAVTLLALFALWRSNLNRLPIESVWPTLAAATAIALGVVVLCRTIAHSWSGAGLMSGLVAVYIFYVPALLDLAPMPRFALLLAHLAMIGLLIWIARMIPREPRQIANLAAKCNLLCLLLVGLTALPLAVQEFSLEKPRRQAQQALPALDGQATANSPDVWHILFDRYAGTDTLRDMYGFDNRPFIEELRRRGFTVQDQAFSNYQRTGHSVASTLNGTLLEPMSGVMRGQPSDWVPIYRAMRDNSALRFFGSQGYRTHFAGSWWEPTRFSTVADHSIAVRAMPQLARLAIDTSSLGFWLNSLRLPYLDGRGDQCFRANEKFRRLKQLAENRDRKYVFAHFLVPHPPFVLNADGSCRSLQEAMTASRRSNYLGQLQFANREALNLVDAILAGPRPAVIVIHSDEGPWPEPYVGNEHGLGTDPVAVDWDKLPDAKLREKMSILLAVRSPDGPPKQMPEGPLQIYPAILKEHFGSRRPLPEARYYLFESDAQLYRFKEVTDRLQAR
jgi:hypothetical protein